MSRSLDKAVLESLRFEDPRPAYNDIASLFSPSPGCGIKSDDELLEIEFLGASHPLEDGVNLLRDGPAVAIPKLRLAQAFFFGRQILQEYLLERGDIAAPSATASAEPEMVPEHVLAATTVLLLMDPEHLTAANIRKRSLQDKARSSSGADGRCSPLFRDAAYEEKHFVDSLLTSRLHRHTKSPTLWSHRRWLLQFCRDEDIAIDSDDDDDDIVRVIMVSGERHPRNYYAWNHARWLLLSRDGVPRAAASQAGGQQSNRLELLCRNVQDWCLRHHVDISGWAFLGFVVSQMTDAATQAATVNAIARDTLRFAASFRWSNESVWVFLRGLVATGLVDEESTSTFQVLRKQLAEVPAVD